MKRAIKKLALIVLALSFTFAVGCSNDENPEDSNSSQTYSEAGAFWYLSGTNESCDTFCSSHGGVNSATIDHVGRYDGSTESVQMSNCENVMDAIGVPGSGAPTQMGSSGFGCHLDGATSRRYDGMNNTDTSIAGTTYRRVCGCNE